MNNLNLFDEIYYKNNVYLSKNGYYYSKNQINFNQSIFDAIRLYGGLKDFQLNKLNQLKSSFEKLKSQTVDLAIYTIEKELGYGKWLESNAKKRGTTTENANTILKILRTIGRNYVDIPSFKLRLNELNSKINTFQNTVKDAVILSSVHSAKGLEFDSVYLIDLIDGLFPIYNNNENSDLEAERRLFYVGITRARYKLYLLSTKYRNQLSVSPSVFIEEIEEILYDKKLTSEIVPIASKKNKYHIKHIPYSNINVNYEIGCKKIPFELGDTVTHVSYGIGQIIDISNKTVKISFNNGYIKTFAINTVINNQLIKTII